MREASSNSKTEIQHLTYFNMNAVQVQFDGSSIAKTPTELYHFHCHVLRSTLVPILHRWRQRRRPGRPAYTEDDNPGHTSGSAPPMADSVSKQPHLQWQFQQRRTHTWSMPTRRSACAAVRLQELALRRRRPYAPGCCDATVILGEGGQPRLRVRRLRCRCQSRQTCTNPSRFQQFGQAFRPGWHVATCEHGEELRGSRRRSEQAFENDSFVRL